MSEAVTLAQVVRYITLHADETDIDRIYAAAKERGRTLRNIRAAAVTKGVDVTIAGIRPAYLNGLSGTVTELEQKRTQTVVTVRLDAESTDLLRAHRYVPPSQARGLLRIPASCCGLK
ncbi:MULTISPECIES: hypothetical protein [unclassified Streptomyces]|uniref:hypothetical protein n=1 Tax=unclassified Streptomyces TaxID=2593676 RepID=UPI002DD9951F|nr:hypothetical protein [Streptomyces sp. NBC_01766]WSC24902.1 hypothetical protein OIE60_35120 [Streptomyces sp. NBC_01766]